MPARKPFRKKRYVLPLAVLLLLAAFRLALPHVTESYVNRVLADIPGHYGEVRDIDISLITGSYVIHDLYLNKRNASSEVPFLDFKKTEIAIEWPALLKGRVVSEIVMTEPVLIYVFEDQEKELPEDPDLDDWSKALTDLVPIDINKLTVHNGKMAFVQLSANPNIDLHLNGISLHAINLSNVVQTNGHLPSSIHATAVSIGEGDLMLQGRMDMVRKIPNIDASLSLEGASATALNNFTHHYAGIDFDEGTFNLYSEIAIADGYLKGYIKPILKDTKLIGKGDGFLEVLWEGFVGFFKFALKNQKHNTLATKVPLEGDISGVKSKVWPTVLNILKNAWIKAYTNVVDDDVEYEDAEAAADE